MDFLRSVWRDVRHAVRSFRREPTFVAGVVLTLALAVGTNGAMVGLVERLMIAPPPGIQDADRVVRVGLEFTTDGGEPYTATTTSYPVFRAIAESRQLFSDAAAMRSDTMTTGRGTELEEVAVVQASGSYFSVLGTRPARGRFFGPSEDELPNGTEVVVLSHAYWLRHFRGDANAIGRELLLDDDAFTIVGVAPPEFNGTELSATDVFIPLSTALRKNGPGWWSNTGYNIVSVIARLRTGVAATAASQMVTSALRDAALAPANDRVASVKLESIVPGRTARQTSQARIALWLLGVSLIVLLIATANVGTLFLLRTVRRRRDVATRLALGARTSRLARQSIVESLTLAFTGCLVGLLLARWFSDVIRVTLLPHLPEATGIVNRPVLIASALASCGAGLLAGLSPLTQLHRSSLSQQLRTGGGHGSSGRFVLQHALVGIQVALSTLLLIGAGLFVRSLQRVQSQDLGLSISRLLDVTLEFRGYVSGRERDVVHEEVVRQLRTLRGVTGVTVVQGSPFSSHHIPPISIPGLSKPPDVGGQIPIMYGATPEYLDMMGVVLRRGRLFNDRDGAGTPLVVIVNETMARVVWPGQDAIGKCVRAGNGPTLDDPDPFLTAASLPCREVVGVVRDSRARSLRGEGDEGQLMQYYVPFAQLPAPPIAGYAGIHGILIRTEGEPERLATAVQRMIQATSALPVYARVRPYQALIDPQLRSWRIGATLFSVFGALAVGIAALGVFAVVSYLVAQRTQEMGVRLALGGSGASVASLIVRDALRMAGAGAVVGIAMAMVGAPLLQSMLFQTSARDTTIVLSAAAVLVAVTIGAAAVPAWRASRVSPMTVLRTEE